MHVVSALRYFQYVREEMLKDFDRDTDNDAFPIAMPRLVQCSSTICPLSVCMDAHHGHVLSCV